MKERDGWVGGWVGGWVEVLQERQRPRETENHRTYLVLPSSTPPPPSPGAPMSWLLLRAETPHTRLARLLGRPWGRWVGGWVGGWSRTFVAWHLCVDGRTGVGG